MSEYGEPWKINKNVEGHLGATTHTDVIVTREDNFIQANMRPRIVECVNFLAGIPTEILKQYNNSVLKEDVISLFLQWLKFSKFRSDDRNPARDEFQAISVMLIDELMNLYESYRDRVYYNRRTQLYDMLKRILDLVKGSKENFAITLNDLVYKISFPHYLLIDLEQLVINEPKVIKDNSESKLDKEIPTIGHIPPLD